MSEAELGPSERDITIYVRHKIEGWSVRRCAREFGLHFSTVSRICKAIEPWVLRQLVAECPDRQTEKLKTAVRIERVYQLANEGWRKSRKNKEKFVEKTGGEFGDAAEHHIEGQSGDPAFLKVILDAEKARRELWGLDEPKRHQHAAIVKHVGQSADITPDERATRLLADLNRQLDALRAEAERRGLVIDIPIAAEVGENRAPG